MVSPPLHRILPSTADLPCSDDTPVDNENQNYLPNRLLFILLNLWASRMDWYFGVDMAIYHTAGQNPRIPIVPDAFLSLGVERRKEGKARTSYAIWEEGVVPLFSFEMVSQELRGEYDTKLALYAKIGILYYVVYNPDYWHRDQHQPFEVYKLINGSYVLQQGEPYWMPEVGLGIGRGIRSIGGIEQEVLQWYDEQGDPYPSSEEMLEQMRQQLLMERQEKGQALQQLEQERQQVEQERREKEQARQEAERFRQRLIDLGLDPDEL